MRIFFLCIIFLCFLSIHTGFYVSAENITLKSGKKVEGKVIEKTDQYLMLDVEGIPIKYYFDEIESMDGKNINSWQAWYEGVREYLAKVESIDKKSKEAANQFNIQLEEAAKKKDSELTKKILTESTSRINEFFEELKSLSPPEDLKKYHEKALDSYKYMKMANEAVLRDDRDSVVAYNRSAITSLVAALEELKNTYINHNAPKELIEPIDKLLTKYTQLKGKDL